MFAIMLLSESSLELVVLLVLVVFVHSGAVESRGLRFEV
jgi:hypothetical protein